jgi:hypothetical protein
MTASVPDEEIVRILEDAAARLDATGWRTGDAGPHEGPNCVSGAIHWAVIDYVSTSHRHSAEVMRYRRAVEWAVFPVLPRGVVALAQWNDYYCPDGATAADVLRNAAKKVTEGTDIREA